MNVNECLAGLYAMSIVWGFISAFVGRFDWALFCISLAIATRPQTWPYGREMKENERD